jgi:trehalose 6-phosphate phosphatase
VVVATELVTPAQPGVALETMTDPPPRRSGSAGQILDWFHTEPSQILSRCCMFLDVDGTLTEFSDDPASVVADAELIALLQRAEHDFGGALAVVSGRQLTTLDAMLSPLRLSASALYGLERRDPCGVVLRKAASVRALDAARGTIADFVGAHPGLIVEDKGTALALHYRRAPVFAADCRSIVYEAASGLWPDFQVIAGSMVVEIVPAGTSKATGIEEFLLEPPFATRIPIALGDDYSDRDAFAAVHRRGGLALAVGGRIHGDHCLANCRAARQWLSTLVGVHPR